MIKFLDLVSQYHKIKPEIDSAFQNILNDAEYIGGMHLKNFENEFSVYIESKYCIGVGNGTDALEIALEAANIPQGSEIIVPGNSFIATSEAVTRAGHKVIFADVDANNYTLSIKSVKEKINNSTSAIIAVHLYGHPCDMDPLLELCSENDLFLLEDCAQAHGAKYKGKSVGSIGDMGAFSFYPGKNLGAYGDGGAITTNDSRLAERSRMIANHGRTGKYNHEFEGRNSRLDSIQAAVLSVKLRHLPEWTKRRIEIADYYMENLGDIDGLVLPIRSDWAIQVYHLFVIRVACRDKLKDFLEKNEIQTGVHYPVALPKLNAYQYLGMSSADTFYNRSDSELLSLPIGEHLSESELEKVVAVIKNFFNEK